MAQPAIRFPRAGAFTLVEMLVSIAVLTLALSVVGVVFTVTTRTATQAAAYSEAQSWVRQFITEIEADLRQVVPSQSILVIVGGVRPAALTADDLSAQRYLRLLTGDPTAANVLAADAAAASATLPPQYSDPRADILMFITNRPSASQAPPLTLTAGNPFSLGARFSPLLVVYGHAAIDETVFNGSQYVPAGRRRHVHQVRPGDTRSILPANQWILSRRATILVPDTRPGAGVDFVNGQLAGSWDRIVGNFATNDSPGDAAINGATGFGFNLPAFLSFFEGPLPALESPYQFDQSTMLLDDIARVLFYNGNINDQALGIANARWISTVLPNPPAELRTNLALQMIPGCAWFQVEFLMPEDPRNSDEYVDPTPADATQHSNRFEPARWVAVPDGAPYVFVPDSARNREVVIRDIALGGVGRVPPLSPDRPGFGRLNPLLAASPTNVKVRMWPYAIRITVRVYDPRGRLADPIMRSVVHRFD